MVRRSPCQSEPEKSSSHSEYVLSDFPAFSWHHWALQVSFVLKCCVFIRNVCVGPKESNLQAGRNWHPLKRVYLCGSGHTGGCNWGTGSVQTHQFGGEYQLAAMHVDVWITSHSLMSCFRIFSHWHFCWYPDSCRLPSRPGYPASGERHSKDEQLQLWRSLCSHQDQSAEVRPSPPCWSIRWNVQSVISVFLPFVLIVLLQEVD